MLSHRMLIEHETAYHIALKNVLNTLHIVNCDFIMISKLKLRIEEVEECGKNAFVSMCMRFVFVLLTY